MSLNDPDRDLSPRPIAGPTPDPNAGAPQKKPDEEGEGPSVGATVGVSALSSILGLHILELLHHASEVAEEMRTPGGRQPALRQTNPTRALRPDMALTPGMGPDTPTRS